MGFSRWHYLSKELLDKWQRIRTISSYNILVNDIKDEYPCSDEEVREIADILNGKKYFSHTFNLKIQRKILESDNGFQQLIKLQFEEYDILKDSLFELSELGNISGEKMDKLIFFISQDAKEIKTIIDLLESHIIGILSNNIDAKDKIFNFSQNVGIGVGIKESSDKNIFLNLLKILNCILGNTFFRISIVYENGNPHLSLLL